MLIGFLLKAAEAVRRGAWLLGALSHVFVGQHAVVSAAHAGV